MFFARFELPNKFFSLKNRKLFLKTENKRKKQLPNIPLLAQHAKGVESYVAWLEKCPNFIESARAHDVVPDSHYE